MRRQGQLDDNEEKKKTIEVNPKVTQILELIDKDF